MQGSKESGVGHIYTFALSILSGFYFLTLTQRSKENSLVGNSAARVCTVN